VITAKDIQNYGLIDTRHFDNDVIKIGSWDCEKFVKPGEEYS